MKIAVIGTGAIGNLVAGYLRLKDEDVSLVGRQGSLQEIKERGLRISGVRGSLNVKIDTATKLGEGRELVILAVKTQDLETAIKDNLGPMKSSAVLTTQNGVQADNIAARYIPRENIISSIVMFGSTYLEPGKVVHNFEGDWIIGKISGGADKRVEQVKGTLDKAFPVVVSDDIMAMKYLKIFVNANNCIPAILGKSLQESFSDVDVSRISVRIWEEGLDIARRCGVNLKSLPDFPLERVTKLVSLPELEAARIFSGIMSNLSKDPVYGSILQSIKRGRASEIDYINGEFVGLAKDNGMEAPVNSKLVELVHQVEKTRKFLTKKELLECLK